MLTFTFTLTVFPSTCLGLGYCYCVSLYFLFLFLPYVPCLVAVCQRELKSWLIDWLQSMHHMHPRTVFLPRVWDRQTDRQTDRRTDGRSLRYAAVLRASRLFGDVRSKHSTPVSYASGVPSLVSLALPCTVKCRRFFTVCDEGGTCRDVLGCGEQLGRTANWLNRSFSNVGSFYT